MEKTKKMLAARQRNAWKYSLNAMLDMLTRMQQIEYNGVVSDLSEYSEEEYDKIMVEKGRLTLYGERALITHIKPLLQELIENWSKNTEKITKLINN